jgi:hypothetical protein
MTERLSRRQILTTASAAAVMGVAGCAALDSGGERVELGEDVATVTFVGASPPADEPANAPPFSDRTLPLPVSLDRLRNESTDGGPPKDGIPAIDDPTFVSPSESNRSSETTVFGAALDGEARAYPRDILVHHEIVNDTLGSTPVSVTYCPLTGTAQGFLRGETTFGVSGMLVNNNLIMYDRELERWWPQIAATSIPGPWDDTPGGATLQEFDVAWTTLGQWQSLYPDTEVLSTDTGYARDYNTDPYGNYYERENTIFGNIYRNDRYHPKAWVYGARTEAGAVAVTRDLLHDAGTVPVRVGERSLLAVHDARLDTSRFYRNPEETEFDHDGTEIIGPDGTAYAPDSLPLDPVVSMDAYWFAWFAYYPNTVVYE